MSHLHVFHDKVTQIKQLIENKIYIYIFFSFLERENTDSNNPGLVVGVVLGTLIWIAIVVVVVLILR